MSVSEQAGNVVKTVTEGFRGAPACLASVVLVAVLAYLVHTGRENEQVRAHERFLKIIGVCMPNEIPPSKIIPE